MSEERAPETSTAEAGAKPDGVEMNMARVPYNHDFVCTYHLMDDDPEMAHFLYQVQLTTAFCMQRHLFSMVCDVNPATNMFDSARVQAVFDYLVHDMHIHENKKFVNVVRSHPLVRGKNHAYAYKSECAGDTDEDRVIISESLLWLISFQSFHAFHKCMVEIFLNGSAQLISDKSLDALKKTFDDFEGFTE
jgi:hypothetical protein